MEHLALDIFDSENEELCQLYWRTDDEGDFSLKVSEIAKKTGFRQSDITKIVKNSCVAYSPNIQCSVCGSPKEFTSRSEYQACTPFSGWECSYCIEDKHIALDEKKRELLEESLRTARSTPIDTEEMDFRTAAFFLALVRYSANEDLSKIQALAANQDDLLSPDSDFDLQIVKHLYRSGIIAVSPTSALDAIELNEEGGFSFYLNKVTWELPLKDDDSLPRVVSRIEKKFQDMEYIDTEYESVREICQEICLLECLAYLNYVVEDWFYPELADT